MGDCPVTSCQLCGESPLELLLDMGNQPLAERFDSGLLYPLRLMECENCGLVQLGDRVPPSELFPPDHPYATGNSATLRGHFRSLAMLASLHLEPGDLVADIGANDGTLIGSYSGAYRRLAVEPTNQVRKAPIGVMTCQEFFTADLAQEFVALHGQAKVITACNVLAHVPDLHDFIEGAAILLARDGVFYTENHSLRSVTEDGQWDTVYHEHARYWNIRTLSQALGMHGLEVVIAHEIDTHGGSFRIKAVHRRDAGLRAAPETARKLYFLLANARTAGPVYGIGAATRAVPLIHYAGIKGLIDKVCEVTGSEKTGKVIPGTTIPVVDEKQLIADQPPHALLLSWHMAGMLVPKLRHAGYKGKFITPLPEPRIDG